MQFDYEQINNDQFNDQFDQFMIDDKEIEKAIEKETEKETENNHHETSFIDCIDSILSFLLCLEM